jgi:hypothetical protein
MDGDIFTSILLGLARWTLPLSARFVGLALYTLWVLMAYISLNQFGWQFLYRYLLVCRGWRMPFAGYLASILTVPLFMSTYNLLVVSWIPIGDQMRVRNPLIAEALGMPIPPPEGFAIRTNVRMPPLLQ